MSTQWRIGEWGSQCGPRPGGGGAAGGSVSIKQMGSELTIHGGTRSYQTTQCWEQFPGLAPRSHSGGKRGWRTTCKTGANDPRQATVITTLSATDDAISFDETGQYQFVISGANCTASVRRTQSFRLIQREGEAPPAAKPSAAPSAAPAPSAVPTPKPANRCAEPGEVARLEVRPGRKLIQPGEEFAFRASVVDAAGCPTGQSPRWSVPEGSQVSSLGGGKIRVDKSAGEGDVKLTASIAGRSVEVVLEVASKERYEALLAAGDFDETGEKGEAIAVLASGAVGSKEVSAAAKGGPRWGLLIAIGGVAALLLGGGLVFALRGRKASSEPAESELASSEQAGEAQAGVEVAGAQPPRPAWQGQTVVIPDAPPPPAPAPPCKTICPTCGTIYQGDAQFCGNDQTQLLPMN